MKSNLTNIAVTVAWCIATALLVAIFAVALVFVLHGDLGLGVVLIGLALMQAMVMVALFRRPDQSDDKPEQTGLSAAE